MVPHLKRSWPLVITSLIFILAVAACFLACRASTSQGFIYPLDDTYIHLSLARNLAEHGVWGISPAHFTSLSSSLLWTLVLSSLFLLFGVQHLLPFLLAVFLAWLLLFFTYRISVRHRLTAELNFTGLIAVFFFTPLTPLIFSGLEHVAHILLTLITAYTAVHILLLKKVSIPRRALLCGLVALNSMVRYEAVFLLLIISLLFLVRKRWLSSLALAVCGTLPLFVFGLISHAQGWYMLPNSILLKGRIPDIHSLIAFLSWLSAPWRESLLHPHLILLMLVSAGMFLQRNQKRGRFWETSSLLHVIFLSTAVLHIQFAALGWFFRYEAYLMAMGILAILLSVRAPHLKQPAPVSSSKNPSVWRYGMGIILVVSAVVLGLRGVIAIVQTPKACRNIYEQQYQMGLFLKTYYEGEAIAANDIGAINYYADIDCVDLWGLANMEIARAKRDGSYGPRVIQRVARSRHVTIAVAYEDWYLRYGGLPEEWIKVAEWTIRDNVVCGDDTVSFYAVNPGHAGTLRENLKSFSQKLPGDVASRFFNQAPQHSPR